MDAPISSDERGCVRGLRPIFYWLILVLVLYGIRTHQRLMEKTLLNFSVSMQGQAIDATATFDGNPAFSGQKIPLGNHTFTITHPKGETFSTNMFVWYGEHDLGTIVLKRQMGTLFLTADPTAPFLFIRGPEWSVSLTNSHGFTVTVPTDQYTVESRYAHWESSDVVTVFSNSTAIWRIAPQLGAVALSCNQSDATFQMLTFDDRQEEAGGFPTLIAGLPEGNHKVISQHHGHQRDQLVYIKAGATNDILVEYLYGTAVLETEPPDAFVQDADGREWGVTPVTLPELSPGTFQVTLYRAGYEPVRVSLEITANQTATFHTNLISTTYTGEMKSARYFMDTADYDRALQAIGDALIAKPDDAEAMALQREATGLGEIKHAKELAQQGDYIGGEKELALPLQLLPDNTEARHLLADYKKHEPEQIERQRVERLNLPQKMFDALCDRYPDSKLFDEHELKTSKKADEVADGIPKALLSVQPPFVLNYDQSPAPGIHMVIATQKFTTGILSFAERSCLIIVGQTKDDESQIIFKVLEYQRHHSLDMSAPLNHFSINEELTPVSQSRILNMTDKLKAQIQEGVSNVTARIQMAIGQPPAVSQ